MSAKSHAKRLALRAIEHAPDLFSAKLRHPVFVIGYCRSGKSLLSRALSFHPKICLYPSEANKLWHPELYPWGQSSHCDVVNPIWWDSRSFVEASLRVRQPDWSTKVKKALGAWQLLKRGEVLLNDSAMTLFLVDVIRQEFKNARFVHVVRDGRAASWVYAKRQYEMNQRLAATLQHNECISADFGVVLERCADYWADQIRKMEKWKERGDLVVSRNLHEVRYEDLCREPRKCIDGVLDFLDLEKIDLSRGLPDDLLDRNEAELHKVESSVLSGLTARLGSSLAVHRYS